MSVKRRQNWQGQQRVDVPHLKSVESAISNDFDELLAGLVTGENESYVIRGFKINMPGAIGSSANGLQLIVENSSFLHGASNESGTFYSIPTGTPAEILSSTTNTRVEGAFTPNTDNYIGLEFVRSVDDTTADQVYFWNPTTNIEITKTVPLAIILDYKVVIATSAFASNVLPVAIVQTDASNNVISITDRRPLLCRLGTAGASAPDPFYSFPWTDGRAETFYTSTSSTADPFFGGDKQIGNLKEFFDALMTEFKLLKGTPFWYSASAGSISRLRQDIANTAFTGKGNVVHGALDFQGQVVGMVTDVIIKTVNSTAPAGITLVQNGSDIDALISAYNVANPDDTILLFSGDGSQIPTVNIVLTSKAGQINWSSDIFLNFIGGRLRYAISANDETQDITLADNEVAYLELVRGENIIPNLVFTNGGTIVTSVGSVNWTTDLVAGDFVKDASQGDDKYYEIQSVDSLSQVTLTTTFLELSSGAAGFDAQYAFGVYETNPAPSSNRHIKVADRALVPFNEDAFWLFFRQDDVGSVAKIYARVLGGQELEQGEAQDISDNTSLATLNYIGAASESDSSPDYLNAIETAVKEVTTFTIPPFASVADGQYFTINSASDIAKYYAYLDTTGGNLVDPTPSGLTSIYVDISGDTTNLEVAASIHAAINALGDFDSVDNVDGTITVTNADFGATTDAVNGNVGGAFNAVVGVQGVGEVNHYLIDGENLTRGEKRLDSAIFGVSSGLLSTQKIIRQNKNSKLIAGGTWLWNIGGANELQTINFDAIPDGGAVTLNIGGNLSSAIGYSDNAAAIKAAIEATTGVTEVTVTVFNSTDASGGFSFEFTGADAYTNFIQAVESSSTLVIGVTPIVSTIATLQAGTAILNELSLSADAYVQVPELLNVRNTVLAQSVVLANDGDVAYVSINRDTGVASNLAVTVGQINAVSLTDDFIIIARRTGSEVIVGTSSFALADGQRLTLDGAELEIERLLGQLKLTQDAELDQARIGSADSLLLDGSILGQELNDLMIAFDGAVINFTTGIVVSPNGSPLGGNFTPFTVPLGEYFWYGVSLTDGDTDAINRQELEVLIEESAAGSNAVQSLAELPAITGDKKLGSILVLNNGGNIEIQQVRRFGVGSGGGGGGGSVKVIEDSIQFGTGVETTVTFAETYTLGKTGIKFFRNGTKMNLVTAYSTVVGDESYAQEYKEVGSGPTSTQIELNPEFPAGEDGEDLFEMCHIQNTFEDFGLSEKILLQARASGDGTELVDATLSIIGTAPTEVTRLGLTAWTFNPNFSVGKPLGELVVMVNGQCVERLTAGINDVLDNILYVEDPSGTYIDIYRIIVGGTERMPDDTTIKTFKIQYTVAELDAVAANIAPAVDNLYSNGTGGNGWAVMFAHLWAGDLIPDIDDGRNLGSLIKRWQDIFLGPGSLNMNDGVNTALIEMQGGRIGFVQPGEAFKEFGSVDDEAILGASDTQTYVKKVMIDSANTEITNRSQVEDSDNSLRCLQPKERVTIASISLIPDEYGPDGRTVYELSSKDSRIRVCGKAQMFHNDNSGSFLFLGSDDDFIEVEIDGTGLNLVGKVDGFARPYEIFVDGVSDGVKNNISYSSILNSRIYRPNQILPGVTGLTSGRYTIKIKMLAGDKPHIVGIEILNEDTQFTVKQGKAFSGLTPIVLASDTNLPFKPATYVGTKGARVTNYIDPADGTAKQVFTNVDATALFLNATDHTNEEQVREGGIYWRDFGAGRADDFSTLTGAVRNSAFTLDDGTTTLTGNCGTSGVELSQPSNGGTTLTFVGTGFDLVGVPIALPSTIELEVFVNDILIGILNNASINVANSQSQVFKIVSGLPYGTHNIKFNRTAASGGGLTIKNLIPYGPKKPTLPAGAVELLDYNVVADHIFNGSTGDEFVDTGVVRKMVTREMIYSGAWGISGINVPSISGFPVFTSTIGNYMEYTFYGTGFVLRGEGGPSYSTVVNPTLNGLAATTTNFPTMNSTLVGWASYTGSGTLSCFNAGNINGCGLNVRDLPEAWYTLRVTNNNANIVQFESVDIITPIHINKPSFKGSEGALDARNFSLIKEVKPEQDLGKAKALVLFDGVSNELLFSKNISSIQDLSTGQYRFYFEKPFVDTNYTITTGAEESVPAVTLTITLREKRADSVRVAISRADTGAVVDNLINLSMFGKLVNEDGE